MTWQIKAMKDASSCDKLRWAANKLWPEDFRMGKPNQGHTWLFCAEYIGIKSDTRGIETSKYPEENKTKVILLVAASEERSG